MKANAKVRCRTKFSMTQLSCETPRHLFLTEFRIHQKYRSLNGVAYSQIAGIKQ